MVARAAVDPLDAIDAMIAAGEDIWEAAVSAAADDEQDMAAHRWRLGDLARRVQKQYGKNRLGDFAKQINVPVPTVKQYRRMSDFYPPDTRYLFENIGYSHYRQAMRLKDLGAALELLTVCSGDSRTVEATQVEINKIVGKPTPPVKLLDAEAAVQQVDTATGVLVLIVGRGADLAPLLNYDHIQLKVYEPEAA